mmetsp:Transcript_26742/g.70238  ORF Transcript_26742/g.70238 Transcript_26742/m.70238 type:complete len:281 (-) Transcript_26742:206-1048(-)
MPVPSESDNKLYVGGLSFDTTKETLEAHFRQHGEIVDCIVMLDNPTKRPRGFGFVTFKESSSMNAALGTSHLIDGRDVIVKKAVREAPQRVPGAGAYNVKKVFVGGLPQTCDFDKLVAHFGRYGKIEDAVVLMDQQTRRHRGFGYVTFAETSAVEATLQNYADNRIDGKWIEVKRCIPQDAMKDKGKGSGKSEVSLPPMQSDYADQYARWYGAYGAAYYGMYPEPCGSAFAAPYGMPPGYPDTAYPAYGMYPAMYGMGPYGPRHGSYGSHVSGPRRSAPY